MTHRLTDKQRTVLLRYAYDDAQLKPSKTALRTIHGLIQHGLMEWRKDRHGVGFYAVTARGRVAIEPNKYRFHNVQEQSR